MSLVRDPILVTGGAGFVGSALALRLKQDVPDAAVVAFDNLRRRGSERNVERLQQAGVRFVHGDVRSAVDLAAVRPEPQLILECSAEPSVLAGRTGSPEYVVETNLLGCFQCLELARRTRSDFVFVSTSRVYPVAQLNALAFEETPTRYSLLAEQASPGASGDGIAEEFPLDGTRTLYGATKLAGELLTAEYAEAYGLRTVIDRCAVLAGPGQFARSDQGVITLWVAGHVFRRPLTYIGFGGNGKQVRDVLHIDDFCDLVVDQLGAFDRYGRRAWNVGGGTSASVSLREVTEICRSVTDAETPVTASAEERPGDLRIFVTDHRRVSAVNGWAPRRGPRETIESIAEWLVREREWVEPVIFP